MSPKALTDSDKCRHARKRRLDRERERDKEERSLPDDIQRMRRDIAGTGSPPLVSVMREELRPVVREAITEETIRAINDLVHLAPRAVELIAADMESDDAMVRQKAYTLMMKYTVGHPALVAHEDAAAGSQINVHFELPRPDVVEARAVELAAEDVPEEDRECDICHTTKPVSEFVANSSRCQTCFDNWKETILQDYAGR